MKAKVIRAFWDLQDPKQTVYQVGSSFEGKTERVRELAKKGFLEIEKPKTSSTRSRKG